MQSRLWRSILALSVLSMTLGSLSGCALFGDNESKRKAEEEEEERIKGNRRAILELEPEIRVDPRLANFPVTLPPSYVNFAWPQPGGAPNHVLNHLDAGGRDGLEIVRRVKIGKGSDSNALLTAPPVVAEDLIFVMDTRSKISAWTKDLTERVWQVDLAVEGEPAQQGFGGGIAYEGGRVFVATGWGFVVGLDAKTGEEEWRRVVGVPFRSAPTAFGGRVFVSTIDNHLHALATDSGLVTWDYRALSESAGILKARSPAVDTSLVVAPFTSGDLVALRAENGQDVWTDNISRTGLQTPISIISDIAGRPVIAGSRVIAISHSGRMVAIDKRSGERIWTRDIGGLETPWVAGNFMFLVTTNAELLCMTVPDGRVRWITELDKFRKPKDKEDPISWVGPILASEQLILASSEGYLEMVSPYTGEKLSRLELPGPVFVNPIAADGNIYILTDEGELVLLN